MAGQPSQAVQHAAEAAAELMGRMRRTAQQRISLGKLHRCANGVARELNLALFLRVAQSARAQRGRTPGIAPEKTPARGLCAAQAPQER